MSAPLSENLCTTASTARAPTSEEILANIRKLFDQFPPAPPDPLFAPLFRMRPQIAGLDVIERPPPPPKIQTSEAYKEMFPELAAEWDRELLEMFGRREDPLGTNMYHFSRYLSVPYGVLRSPLGILNASVS